MSGLKLKKKELEAVNYSPVELAKLEMEKGVLPITIRRPLPIKPTKKEEEESS